MFFHDKPAFNVNELKYLRDYARLWHVMPIFVRKLTTKHGKQRIKQVKHRSC
ncbi:hypothetical protein HMPREF9019_2226 [Hoylesella timonensis CRIS 5C-B1]|uniref:Uncharacterized protein n=1 Tax=Hoylesella timonensis CRIS 5C-B1 TaxID=679189 RepID=D1VWU8_9BACT|nr:hypothetical protein HMPREF9019_2226 [Hoylesella timonensis CRIS 5C-B1]